MRRFAELRWIVPRLTARSSSELKARTCAAAAALSFDARAEADFFESVLMALSVLRLRTVRTVAWRARLAEDLMLAMEGVFCWRARGENRTRDQGLMSPLLYR